MGPERYPGETLRVLTLRERDAALTSAFGLFVLVIVLRCWLVLIGPFPGDTWAASLRDQTQMNLVRETASLYGLVGSPVGAVTTVLLVGVAMYRWTNRQTAIGLLLSSAVVVPSAVLKLLWGPTPLWLQIAPFGGVNFPSGHTAYATSVFGYIAAEGSQRYRGVMGIVCLIAIVGMGPARIMGGAHLVSDVVAGYLLGGSWLILARVLTHPDVPAALSVYRRS